VSELLALLAKGLVDEPDEVVVTKIESEHATVLQLKVARDDLGKVIGKQGRTARSIRTLLSAAGRTPLGRIQVMLIPVDPSTAPAFARPNASTNEQGSFILSGAPGEYFVVNWARGEPLPPRDPEALKQLPNATRVTLGPGERKTIELIK